MPIAARRLPSDPFSPPAGMSPASVSYSQSQSYQQGQQSLSGALPRRLSYASLPPLSPASLGGVASPGAAMAAVDPAVHESGVITALLRGLEARDAQREHMRRAVETLALTHDVALQSVAVAATSAAMSVGGAVKSRMLPLLYKLHKSKVLKRVEGLLTGVRGNHRCTGQRADTTMCVSIVNGCSLLCVCFVRRCCFSVKCDSGNVSPVHFRVCSLYRRTYVLFVQVYLPGVCRCGHRATSDHPRSR